MSEFNGATAAANGEGNQSSGIAQSAANPNESSSTGSAQAPAGPADTGTAPASQNNSQQFFTSEELNATHERIDQLVTQKGHHHG